MPPLAMALIALAMSTDLSGSVWRPSQLASYELPAENRMVMKFADGQLTGNGGCNQFFSAYKVDGSAIKIGPLASTRKGCPDTMTLEMAFFAALRSAKSFEQGGNTLILFDATGRELAKFIKIEGA